MSEPALRRVRFGPQAGNPQLIAAAITYSSNKRVMLEINPEYGWVKHIFMKKVIAFNNYSY
jgi:hypothetical protein